MPDVGEVESASVGGEDKVQEWRQIQNNWKWNRRFITNLQQAKSNCNQHSSTLCHTGKVKQ